MRERILVGITQFPQLVHCLSCAVASPGHIHTHARTHAHTYARTHAHTRTHTNTHARTYTRTHARTHAHTHARTHHTLIQLRCSLFRVQHGARRRSDACACVHRASKIMNLLAATIAASSTCLHDLRVQQAKTTRCLLWQQCNTS